MSCFVNDLKGKVLCGVSIYDPEFEIYYIEKLIICGKDFYSFSLKSIIGDANFDLVLPPNHDISIPICVYYSHTSAWIYTTDDKKASDIFNAMLNNKFLIGDYLAFENWNHQIGRCFIESEGIVFKAS